MIPPGGDDVHAGDAHARRRALLVSELTGEIRDPRVLEAIGEVPRHLFVPGHLESYSYDNRALPIGEGQTISQPLVVALMTEALRLKGDEKVLEVGTGSGYQAAVLGRLAREVHTIERYEPLCRSARDHLRRAGAHNVHVHTGDGTRGLPEEAPFDAVIVTAGSPHVPGPLRDQLAPGGRLVIPVGDRTHQVLRRVEKAATPEGEDRVTDLSGVVFVPLLGEFGWH